MGVTGTLKILPKCQLNVLESWYKIQKFYSIPSVYGKSRREKLGTKVVKTDNHFTEICSSIKTQIDRNKPVIIFFPTIDMVNNFYQSREFENLKQNAMTLTEKNDHDATKSRIIRATNSRAITVLTKAFGRGIDFIVREKSAK
jgi:late competence protein required for DNA uptake (superfamily II DNA/RNA helicase)